MPATHPAFARPGRRNLVVGLGRTGLSCARWLVAQGERVVVTDSRSSPPSLATLERELPQIPRRLGALDPALVADCERLVLSPGLSRAEPIVRAALERGVPVVGDVELFAAARIAPAVAVTGTNGKSTVTALVAAMAERAGLAVRAGGNLGEPALELLQPPEPDLFVLELSSYQLESTENLELAAAAVLNVSPDHMDRYRNLGEYAAAKARIFAHATVAIVNEDDELTRGMGGEAARVVRFSMTGRPADWLLADLPEGPRLARRIGGPGSARLEAVLDPSRLRLIGRHNVGNALAALAVGTAAGLPLDAMCATLEEFTGLPHRMEWVAERGGVRFIDDSKGTNVGATLAAIEGLPGPLVVIAGGDGKGQDFAPLAPLFRAKVRHAVLIGRDRERLARALAPACPTEFAAGLPEAVVAAARIARPGELVLLSPACASFDMFRDFAQRGEVFAAAARELPP
jgi:UDP-N-acetylmuramoylalanine--D-glutamate ligase